MNEQKQRCPYELAIEKWLGKQQFEALHTEQLHQLVGLLCMFDTDKAKHKDAVEYLMYQVDTMRSYQTAFFRHGMSHDKNQAIAMERKVDATVLKLKGRGYNGDRFKDNTKQSKLF